MVGYSYARSPRILVILQGRGEDDDDDDDDVFVILLLGRLG